MEILPRLLYSACLVVPVVGSAAIIGLMMGFDVIDLLVNPFYAATAYLAALLVVPWVERYFPLGRK